MSCCSGGSCTLHPARRLYSRRPDAYPSAERYFQPEPYPGPLPDEALELLSLYHELLAFKDTEEFQTYCYAVAGPYNDWVERGEALDDRSKGKLRVETGIVFVDLWNMGVNYCNNQGAETDFTRWAKQQMQPHWLAAEPTNTSGR